MTMVLSLNWTNRWMLLFTKLTCKDSMNCRIATIFPFRCIPEKRRFIVHLIILRDKQFLRKCYPSKFDKIFFTEIFIQIYNRWSHLIQVFLVIRTQLVGFENSCNYILYHKTCVFNLKKKYFRIYYRYVVIFYRKANFNSVKTIIF